MEYQNKPEEPNTSLPWVIGRTTIANISDWQTEIYSSIGMYVASTLGPTVLKTQRDAAYIVKCANNHVKLLQAVKAVMKHSYIAGNSKRFPWAQLRKTVAEADDAT